MAPIPTSDYVSAYGPFISPPIPITLNILILIEAINTLYTTWSCDLGATIISFHALSPFFAAALLIVACIPPASDAWVITTVVFQVVTTILHQFREIETAVKLKIAGKGHRIAVWLSFAIELPALPLLLLPKIHLIGFIIFKIGTVLGYGTLFWVCNQARRRVKDGEGSTEERFTFGHISIFLLLSCIGSLVCLALVAMSLIHETDIDLLLLNQIELDFIGFSSLLPLLIFFGVPIIERIYRTANGNSAAAIEEGQ